MRLARISKMVKGILRSFKIRKFDLEIDTGDGVYNGLLIPLSFMKNNEQIRLHINFTGETQLTMIIENKTGRVAWAIFKAYALNK